jgi:ferric-dicitrate binding protein FerR (iron transport regulator)
MYEKEPIVKVEDIRKLIKKYNRGEASEAEALQVVQWYERIEGAAPELAGEEGRLFKDQIYEYLERYRSGERPGVKGISFLWSYVAAAAMVLLVTGVGLWLFSGNREVAVINNNNIAYTHDIDPGKNKATLTLADGRTIRLSDAKTRVVIGASGLRYKDGTKVVVEGGQNGRGTQMDESLMQILTAATPRGGQYQVTLPDGTQVWLNAASSLKFPSTFSKSLTRTVELVGEAYFEVYKDKSHPFIVKTAAQELEVFGTHFNVNSYADEPATKTSLLEGSVGIRSSGGGPVMLLKPGQQAVRAEKDVKLIEGRAADAVDWKNGEFIFNDEPLESIMRKVARWYDVEIIYHGADRTETFGGSISRFEKVSKVLENLQLTGGIQFRIEGRKVIVSKQE